MGNQNNTPKHDERPSAIWGEAWTDRHVCCGFLWRQFADFSNHVKFCPSCGSKIYEIPTEALE